MFPTLRFVTENGSGSREPVSLDSFEENGEWKLLEAHMTIDETNGFYDSGRKAIPINSKF